jgi:hypothetical protein
VNRALLVRLFVPTESDKIGITGTAYPVGKDLILTAWHVVEPPDRDARIPISALWYSYPAVGPDNGWYPLAQDCVVWRGKGDLDAALLQCPRPPEVRSLVIVSRERPAHRN